ncbi:MAG: MIP/aquaporin family protein [Candidatus Njordarchaeum guaymaensis]
MVVESVVGKFIGEFLGTMALIVLGDGVVANVVLNKTKGNNSGWIVITTGWAFAVAVAVYLTGWISGAHINPAVTIGLLFDKDPFPVADVPVYLAGQFLGAFVGAVIVWLTYYDHFKETEDPALKLGVFCTAPAIRDIPMNLLTEIVGTWMLLWGIKGITDTHNELIAGSPAGLALNAFLIGCLVWSIGLSLGGPTGYAINPARDLGPRIAHFVLPIPGKGDSDWGYGLIVPIIGPIIGGILGVLTYNWMVAATVL